MTQNIGGIVVAILGVGWMVALMLVAIVMRLGDIAQNVEDLACAVDGLREAINPSEGDKEEGDDESSL